MLRLAALGALFAAACSFSVPAEGGGDDGIIEGERITISWDTAAEFADPAELADGVIAARGAIEPAAFVLGGLHARAFPGNLLDNDDTFEDALVKTALVAQAGAGYRHLLADWSDVEANRPRGLGLAGPNNFTILYDGEVLLPEGSVMLQADADDRAIVQVALDGSTFGERLFARQGMAAITLDVPAAGWYPIRAAYAQAGGAARFTLAITPMFGAQLPIDDLRLRARVTDAPGLVAFGFESRAMLTPLGEAAVPTIDADYGPGAPPFDLGGPNDDFSVRFAGQVRIDEPGAYTFSADIGAQPSDLYRLWIDGAVTARHWPPMEEVPTATVDLAPGWHDLLLDYADLDTTARVTLRMQGPGIADAPIDPARLRPAVAFGLTSSFVDLGEHPLMDATTVNGVTTVPLPLLAAPGAVIDAVDVGFGIANQRMSDLEVARLDCDAATILPLANVPSYHYFAYDLECAGHPVTPPAPWAFRVIDRVPGNGPEHAGAVPALWNPTLVATYHGGDRRPFAPVVTYVSRPVATPGAIGYAYVNVIADRREAAVAIEVRTAADEGGLATATWLPVGDGEVLRAPPGEVLQYRLSMVSDGWQLASVDKVEITYVVLHGQA